MQERFQKYRGLKSFRTSAWSAREGLPKEYTRIFAFEDLARAKKLAMLASRAALEVCHNLTLCGSGSAGDAYSNRCGVHAVPARLTR